MAILRKLLITYMCDRCKRESIREEFITPIWYGDPAILKDNYQLSTPWLFHNNESWCEFFGNHFCPSCSLIVEPLYESARKEALDHAIK